MFLKDDDYVKSQSSRTQIQNNNYPKNDSQILKKKKNSHLFQQILKLNLSTSVDNNLHIHLKNVFIFFKHIQKMTELANINT